MRRHTTPAVSNSTNRSSINRSSTNRSSIINGSKTSVYSRTSYIMASDSVDESEKIQTPADLARRRRAWIKAVHRQNIFAAAICYFMELPSLLWKQYIETFLVPRYRPEWGRFTRWEPLTPKECKKKIEAARKLPSAKSKLSHKKSRNKKKHQSVQKHATDLPPKPIKHDHSECIPVRINVSGQIFEPQLRTLKQFPNTLLGNPQRMIQFFDPVRDEFFFDRHRSSFEAILYYYNTGGILRRPSTVDAELFLEEVKFFDLGPEVILGLQNIDANAEEDKPLPKNLLKRKIWLLFEYPESSYQSRILAYISVMAVCISIFEFCIETLPDFSVDPIELRQTYSDSEREQSGEDTVRFSDPFFFTETICIIFFVLEYLIRAVSSPNFFDFAKDISNLIDLVAILPYFLNLLYALDDNPSGGDEDDGQSSAAVSLTILRIIRLVRVFRILKLSRHNRGLKILGKTLKSSIRELGLLVFFLMVGVVVFSSAIFFAESQYENSQFKSVPTGFWFGVVTMTTLGYGDIVPVGPWGKIIGALCAIAGVLTISLPVPVIVSNFNMFYNSEEVNSTGKSEASTNSECNYVEQCPYYPAWYSHDGQVLGDNMATSSDGSKKDPGDGENSNSVRWLIGEQKMDLSDSDFDDLLKDVALRKHPDIKKTRVVRKEGKSVASRASPAQIKYKIFPKLFNKNMNDI